MGNDSRDKKITKIDLDILKTVCTEPQRTQRNLSIASGYSLGKVNQSLHVLKQHDFIDESYSLTAKALHFLSQHKPRNAIILAAGIGMRIVPGNTLVSKGLLEINGEILIERLIRQLKEKGISDITVVVGFMKESFEYLIDKFDINLIVNTEYEARNNLHSLALARSLISNTYILPCDLWCRTNPFSDRELYSWFMVSNEQDESSYLKLNRKSELVEISPEETGNKLLGIAYISKSDAALLRDNLAKMDKSRKYKGAFWEESLIQKNKLYAWGKQVDRNNFLEINTSNELETLINNPSRLSKSIRAFITSTLKIHDEDIHDVQLLKNGPSNRTLHFSVRKKEYTVKIPKLSPLNILDGKKEIDIHAALSAGNVSHNVLAMDEKSGIKIASYISNARPIDIHSDYETKLALEALRNIHKSGVTVEREIDIFNQVELYERLRGRKSLYPDYETTKENVFSLRKYINENASEKVLCHGDPVASNFLYTINKDIVIIDWDDAGMGDPDIDLAMFAIASLFTKDETDTMMDTYYASCCPPLKQKKIYALMAVCGLLWSNWCECKMQEGLEFGEYAMKQYRYAKEYYRLSKDGR